MAPSVDLVAGGIRRLCALIALLGLVAGCSGSAQAAPPAPPVDLAAGGTVTHTYTGRGPKVVLLGDSITVRSWKATYDALTEDHAVMVAAWSGEGYDGGPFSDRVGGRLLPAAAREYAKTNPDVAVLALGTNDAWNTTRDIGRALVEMAAMAAELKPACLVGVTLPVRSPASHWHSDRARALNQAMRSWANEVVDWAKIYHEPGTMSPLDTIHPTDLGEKRRSEVIASAVRNCS